MNQRARLRADDKDRRFRTAVNALRATAAGRGRTCSGIVDGVRIISDKFGTVVVS